MSDKPLDGIPSPGTHAGTSQTPAMSGLRAAAAAPVDPVEGALTVNGAVFCGSSELYFSDPNHPSSGVANTAGWAGIENAKDLDALSIAGRVRSNGRKQVLVSDDLQVTGGLAALEGLDVGGALTVGGAVTLAGATTLNGDVSASGRLKSGSLVVGAAADPGAGNASIEGQLEVSRNVSVNQNLHVTGSATVNGSASVSGNLTVNRILRVSGTLRVSDGLNADGGAIELKPDPSAPVRITGDLAVSDGLTVAAAKFVVGNNGQLKLAGDVNFGGGLDLMSNSNPVRFSSAWTAFPDNKLDRAEICNDTGQYKTLMIVGNRSGGGGIRRVGVWDHLEVTGTLNVTREIHCLRVIPASDRNAKESIEALAGVLDQVLQLQPVSFRWKADRAERTAHKQLGLIAQEVREVVPSAVVEDAVGRLGIHYDAITCLLLKAVQEQQALLVALQDQVERLERRPSPSGAESSQRRVTEQREGPA